MKKLLYSAITLSLAFASCKEKDNNIAVAGVSLNQPTATLSLVDTLILTPTISPTNATNDGVTWKSSDTTVAKVNNGVVILVGYGTATITVSTTDGNFTDNCAITVKFLLGQVSFKTSQTWTISGNDITQEWSDVVMASGCKKDNFNGGSTSVFNADCRQNPGYGDLFSWVAVNTYKNELCPNGWRVPTAQDFIDLDIAMGGTGNNRDNALQFINDNYLNSERWGGNFGGSTSITNIGVLVGQGSSADYWSLSEYNAERAFTLGFRATGNIYLSTGSDIGINKNYGVSLRCVRNN
jgi:uncharacterized protein (TIGR02145 family)